MSGRRKSLSHHLSRRTPDDDELDAAIEEFQAGSDRVAAIMGSALVEHFLMDAIRQALADAFSDGALFHDQGAPFGTFKARIVAGRALGLYDEAVAADLDRIRDIRNQFAHALLNLRFDNPHLVESCKEFGDYEIVAEDGAQFKYENPYHKNISEARQRFEIMCWKLTIILLRKATEILQTEADRMRAELDRLQNPRGRNALADLVTASMESREKDVEDNIASDKG